MTDLRVGVADAGGETAAVSTAHAGPVGAVTRATPDRVAAQQQVEGRVQPGAPPEGPDDHGWRGDGFWPSAVSHLGVRLLAVSTRPGPVRLALM